MTPCPPVRNKVSSKSNHIPVVTFPDNIPSNTVQTPVIDDKGANSDDHHESTAISSNAVTSTSSATNVDLPEGMKPRIHATTVTVTGENARSASTDN